MSAFSKEAVARATAAIPATATKTLEAWVKRGYEQGLIEFAECCEAELALRGSETFDTATAEMHAAWAQQSREMEFPAVLHAAFVAVPPNAEEERPIIRLIAAHPGISHSELVSGSGLNQVSLILGHLIHHRHGFFRRWLPEVGKTQSDLLLERDHSGSSVTYRFRPVVETGFRDLGLID